MSSLSNVALAEQVACKTVISMLESSAMDETYGTPEA